MKCKDIPDKKVLQLLKDFMDEDGRWANYFEGHKNSVIQAMPIGTPEKLAHAKMKMMIRRGVVDGCRCGCRGDFVITQKGIEELRDEMA